MTFGEQREALQGAVVFYDMRKGHAVTGILYGFSLYPLGVVIGDWKINGHKHLLTLLGGIEIGTEVTVKIVGGSRREYVYEVTTASQHS